MKSKNTRDFGGSALLDEEEIEMPQTGEESVENRPRRLRNVGELEETGAIPKRLRTVEELEETGAIPKRLRNVEELEETGTIPKRLRNVGELEETGTLPKGMRPDLEYTGAVPKRMRPDLESTGALPKQMRPDLESTGAVPKQMRPDLESTGAVPKRMRPDLESTGAVPKRMRPDLESTGAVPKREQPDLESTGAVPKRMRPDLESTGAVPKRMRPDLESTGALPKRIQPDLESTGAVPKRIRPDLESTGAVPKRERLDLESTGAVPKRERPDFESTGAVPKRERLDLESTGAVPKRMRPDFESTGAMPKRALPDFESTGAIYKRLQPNLENTGAVTLEGTEYDEDIEDDGNERVTVAAGRSEMGGEAQGMSATAVEDKPSARTVAPSRVRGGGTARVKEKEKKTYWLWGLLLFFGTFVTVGGGYFLLSVVKEAKEQEERPVPEISVVMPDEGDFISYQGLQIPVHMDVPVNSYDGRGFYRNAQGYMCYEVDGVSAIPGIDVSYHQKSIDWQLVAEAGFEFAMIRAGRRGYGEEGSMAADVDYAVNIQGALDNDMEVGVYFFSQAVNMEEVKEEVEFLLELLEEFDISYPVVFDWEFISTDYARTDEIEGEQITEMAIYFCERVAEAGYIPAVYFNTDMAYKYMDISQLKQYPFWLAELSELPRFYYHFDMWQYTFTGNVPGIVGDVDLNLSFRDFAMESYNLKKAQETV